MENRYCFLGCRIFCSDRTRFVGGDVNERGKSIRGHESIGSQAWRKADMQQRVCCMLQERM